MILYHILVHDTTLSLMRSAGSARETPGTPGPDTCFLSCKKKGLAQGVVSKNMLWQVVSVLRQCCLPYWFKLSLVF